MSNYEKRFDVLKEYLYEPPKPSRIYNIMSALELSQRLAMELCFNLTRSTFRNYLKKEIEQDGVNNLMPTNTWRYFKINCCVYADKYNEPSPYTNHNAKKMFKHLAHIHLDLVRYLNNWYNLANFVTFDSDKKAFIKSEDLGSYRGVMIDKGDINIKTNYETNIELLLNKAEEVASILGFTDAEAMMAKMTLNPENSKIELIA